MLVVITIPRKFWMVEISVANPSLFQSQMVLIKTTGMVLMSYIYVLYFKQIDFMFVTKPNNFLDRSLNDVV